ncbi:MepB family protein [Flammeovirga sp. SJP92]|uniref:MepB family protein n=1 Tax=Flammeovirga sp. SJP92 TaxID=1775430 RepID=UPI000787814A|nr:MepB family protein [Flammeovirga sp. SJP92]KXX67241.1 MepB family protein [Flammeovirga sp. SJP92]
MYKTIEKIKTEVYDECSFQFSDFEIEHESQEYEACRFKLNGMNILSRKSKITPKKVGQFVTFWKRNQEKVTAPFNASDPIDFYVVNVQQDEKTGQFVFPKSVLIKKGIMTTNKKEGKRGFRVYPSWNNTTNKQAERTQKWQLNYFYEINNSINLKKITDLYEAK